MTVLWGVLDDQGRMFEFVLGPSPKGQAFPGAFDGTHGALFLAGNVESFEEVGRAVFWIEEAYRGWAVLGQRTLVGGFTARVFANGEALFFAPAGKARLSGLVAHPFCFVRRSELKGWSGVGRHGLCLYCLGLSEFGAQQLQKVRLRLRTKDARVRALLEQAAGAPRSARELDGEVSALLPHAPAFGPTLQATIGPLLLGLFGLFGSLGVASFYPPGSPGAVTWVRIGMALLAIAFPLFFVSIALQRRRRVAIASAMGVQAPSRRCSPGLARSCSPSRSLAST